MVEIIVHALLWMAGLFIAGKITKFDPPLLKIGIAGILGALVAELPFGAILMPIVIIGVLSDKNIRDFNSLIYTVLGSYVVIFFLMIVIYDMTS